VERSDGVAEVTLDHPPLNLFDESMIEAVIEAIAGLSADPPRAVLFRAEGDVVSGGVNVEEFQGLTADQGRALWTRLMDEVIAPVEALPCPVVFSSHGLTLTAAFELALACDLLAERAGLARAAQLVMTGELFDATTLERWNVVNEVVPDAELDERSRKLARRLARGPTLAHAMTRRILRARSRVGMEEADRVTREEAGELFASEDLIGAVDTFLAEGPGKARFEGR
jgi:enoyl-CoA hydratase